MLWQEVTQQVINDSGTPADLQPALGAYQTTMQDVVSEFLPDGTTRVQVSCLNAPSMSSHVKTPSMYKLNVPTSSE